MAKATSGIVRSGKNNVYEIKYYIRYHELPICGPLVMRFTKHFHSRPRHSLKLLANRLTREPKIVIHRNLCIILYIVFIVII